MNDQLLFLIPLTPLFFGLVNVLFGMRMPRIVAETFAVLGVASATVLTLLLWPKSLGDGTHAVLYSWLQSGDLSVGMELLFDPLSAPMALMVTAVSTLIHLYAIGYMHNEPNYARFFALLNLFVFAMLVIVLADNMLLLFLGWEGVGFCSYGLIGYWYSKEKNANAGRKAFLVTRVGDIFLAIALLWLFALTGTLSISAINDQAALLAPATVTALVLLLLGGACGKSAQLPLMTWLADAMAGPTPVSALIHAATMVTAGVYLLCRLFPLVALSPTGMAAIAIVGAATALYAASCAIAQKEIKRVLAYSTMSQVGYMFLAVGAGAVGAAFFHLLTHAFFKACLFMGAGCIIHLAGEENDITRMGGMAKGNRLIFAIFLAVSLCLAGAPFTGGFFSKDAILLATYARHTPLYSVLWGAALLTAFLTAAYTFRLVYLVFFGPSHSHSGHHSLPKLMIWPLVPLALAGLGGGLLNLPPILGHEWLQHHLGSLAGESVHASHLLEWGMAGVSLLLVAAGWGVAHKRFSGGRDLASNGATRFLLAGWYADALVERLVLRPFTAVGTFFWKGIDRSTIDGLLEMVASGALASGGRLRRLTSGRLSTYLTALAWGFLLLLGWGLLEMVKS